MFSEMPDFEIGGCTVILPSISIGNVPQLTLDLLINNTNPVFVGHIYHEDLVPVVGPNAFDNESKHIASSCEVYYHAEKKLVLLQIRGAIVLGRESSFTQQLAEWAFKKNAKDIIVLSSLSAEIRKDEDLEGSQLRYILPTVHSEEYAKKFSSFGWIAYDNKGEVMSDKSGESREVKIYLPGGGFGLHLYKHGNKMGLPTTVLMMFAYEGDNQNEAMMMADSLNLWLVLEKDSWVPPVSWSSWYGNAPPPEIY